MNVYGSVLTFEAEGMDGANRVARSLEEHLNETGVTATLSRPKAHPQAFAGYDADVDAIVQRLADAGFADSRMSRRAAETLLLVCPLVAGMVARNGFGS